MAILIKILILLATNVICSTGNQIDSSPALIWGTNIGGPFSVFEVVTTEELSYMLLPYLRTHLIIVYLMPELTIKHLVYLDKGAYLRRVRPVQFFGRVQWPLLALQQLGTVSWIEPQDMFKLTCQNHIYVIELNSENLGEQDAFIAAASNHLVFCPVIHILTAYRRFSDAFYHSGNMSNGLMGSLSDYETSSTTDKPNSFEYNRIQKVDGNQHHKNKTHATIMRHRHGIISLKSIVLADEVKKGLTIYYDRHNVVVSSVLGVDLVDKDNIRRGFTFIMETSKGSLKLEVLPILSNWRISRIILGNVTFTTTDLVFYGRAFSLCCYALTAISHNGSRISLYSLSMDVVLKDTLSALDSDYKPKPCWLCEEFLTPGISQVMFTVLLLVAIFGIGVSMFLNMGISERLSNPLDPDIHVRGAPEH